MNGKGSFQKRLEHLEQAIKFREPRQIVITAYDDAEAAKKIAGIRPPITDSDLVVILRQFARPDAPNEPDTA
jgi:hypothetical protein